MFKDIFVQLASDNEARKSRAHAPLFEQYAREVEEQTFWNINENRLATYKELANTICKFSSAGITAELNPKQIQACLNQV